MSASRKLRGFCINMGLRSWNKWHSSHVDCRAGLAALAREHCTRMCQREKIAAAAASSYWMCDLNIFESKRWYVIWARVPPEKKRHNAGVENASFRFPPHRSLVYMAAASGLREAHRNSGGTLDQPGKLVSHPSSFQALWSLKLKMLQRGLS